MPYIFLRDKPVSLSFIQLPLFLIGIDISNDAKLLYAVLLRRAGVSRKEKWFDGDGRLYVYYTIKEARKLLGCCNQKAIKTFTELEKTSLILRKKQGCGKPAKILLKTPAEAENSGYMGI